MSRERSGHGGPAGQAAAVALGTYVGCTPFYGLHLPVSRGLASAFGLDRAAAQAAANIANTAAAPLIFLVELQVGAFLSHGAWYSPASLLGAGMWGPVRDLLLGGLAVGALLAVVTGGLTFATMASGSHPPALSAVIDQAAGRYLRSTPTSWEFAHGKLRMDPVYLGLLKRGILPQDGVLVDCGCGRGLMLSLIASAQELRSAAWPPTWPAPPQSLRLYGIESRPRMVGKAREALGDRATILAGDLRDTAIPANDVTLLFDVMHLMPRADQQQLLTRLRDALRPGGLLVLREADAGGGWRFEAIRLFNGATRVLQAQWGRRFHFRTAEGWRQCLGDLGFDVETERMGEGTPFANVMIYARRRMAA